MPGCFNIQNFINVTYYINKLKEINHMITSSDAEKVFDNIQYNFKINALEESESHFSERNEQNRAIQLPTSKYMEKNLKPSH